MRVYEFCKQLGLETKDVMDALQKGGFAIKSHMSVLDSAAIAFLENKFIKKSAPASGAVQATQEQVMAQQQQQQPSANKSSSGKKNDRSRSGRPQSSTYHQDQFLARKEREKQLISQEAPAEIEVSSMMLSDAAHKMARPVNDVILTLLRWGIMSTKNQVLSLDVVERLARQYGIKPIKPVLVASGEETAGHTRNATHTGNLQERHPVVVVLGHVDHGKTTLLDFIRKTRVAAREKGGITQHLGAYEASTPQGNITFLDTPGHEAFSKMRHRGIRVADIAILVVAADDGVMPQTIEAIKQIKSMNVMVIVAVNKIDKVDAARLDIIKRQLAQHDLLPEDWGGEIVCVPLSAKSGEGIDKLLEMISLQAQLMELRADKECTARGVVLEGRLEKGRGAVATLISQHGTLNVGDYIVCASGAAGRINSLVDSAGRVVKYAGPAIPAQASGLEDLPEAGDPFEVVSKQEYLKSRSDKEQKRLVSAARLLQSEGINLVVKTDTNSSREALIESMQKLSQRLPVGFNIIHAAAGDINESDVELAYNTSSTILGLHVKAETNAALLAQRRKVNIVLHGIIYKLLEDLEARAQGKKEVEKVRTKIGEARVLKVFDIKNVGVVAGSVIVDGRFSRDGSAVVWRGRNKVAEGKITSLQRDKRMVKEVHNGFECGFIVEDFTEWQPDDRVECYLDVAAQK
jgi:translation initiation factor IF-2